jgi:uncharacterized membrane protein HdeD (DUF308 family)
MSEVEGTRTQILRGPWWLMLITGIAAVVLGIFLIMAPVRTTVALVQILGIYWLITGVFSLVSIIVDRSNWVWKLFSGVLSIVAGIFIMLLPLWVTEGAVIFLTSLLFVAAGVGILGGSALLIVAFFEKNWGVGILAVLGIIFGIVMFLNPLIAAVTLRLALGGLVILGGIAAIVSSFSNRKRPAMAASTGG